LLFYAQLSIYFVSSTFKILKAWDIPRDLCLNRSAWKAAIEVPEPLLGALGGFQLWPTPTCLGLKGYVVVVVVVAQHLKFTRNVSRANHIV